MEKCILNLGDIVFRFDPDSEQTTCSITNPTMQSVVLNKERIVKLMGHINYCKILIRSREAGKNKKQPTPNAVAKAEESGKRHKKLMPVKGIQLHYIRSPHKKKGEV